MKQKIAKVIVGVCKDLFGVDVVAQVELTDEEFGDFSSNIALQVSKNLKDSPRNVAQKIALKMQENEIFSSVGVAGPGFINITLQDSVLFNSLFDDPQKPLIDQKILVEYSDPNPFKPLHAGHLYTTLVGDTISRLIEQVGAHVTRINYGGDVGLHVAKSMWAIVNNLEGEHPEKLTTISEEERSSWLGDRYVEGNNAYEDNDELKQKIKEFNKKVYEIQSNNDHESNFAQIYWTCRQWSYDYFQQLYKKLEVNKFDQYIPESSVTELGLSTVKEQLQRGVYEESNGAVIFNGEKYGLHTRVFINSEGLPTYETKDVGLSLTKWEKFKFDESIIITASEQAQYMQVVIKSIEQFMPDPAQRTKHITHGVVKLIGGIKMSSRKGNIVTANEILEAAATVAKKDKITEDSEVVLAAVKYAFLKNRIGSDITYDPSESVALEGNSGPYLQYAHARACSILSKSKSSNHLSHMSQNEESLKLDKHERSLVRKISQYNDIVIKAATELAPHSLCGYLYELSQTFNKFYENSQVIGDKRQEFRIRLVSIYASKLSDGLGLLGISAPESM